VARRFIDKLKWYLRKHGFFRLVWLALLGAWRGCINNKYVMFYSDLEGLEQDLWQPEDSPVVTAYSDVRSIPDQDFRQLGEVKGEAVLLPFLDSFFRRGAVLWLAKLDGRVVGLQWTIRAGFKGFYAFPLTSKDVVTLAAEVFPPYRGRGIHSRMKRCIFHELKESGMSRVYWLIRVWNRASLRSTGKQNAVQLGIVRIIHLFNAWITVWSKKSLTEPKTLDPTRPGSHRLPEG